MHVSGSLAWYFPRVVGPALRKLYTVVRGRDRGRGRGRGGGGESCRGGGGGVSGGQVGEPVTPDPETLNPRHQLEPPKCP